MRDRASGPDRRSGGGGGAVIIGLTNDDVVRPPPSPPPPLLLLSAPLGERYVGRSPGDAWRASDEEAE